MTQTYASLLWGPLTRFGLRFAVAAAAADQAVKLWVLYGLDMPVRGSLRLTPFLDLVLVWNTGISYGWFQQTGEAGQWALVGVKVIAIALLWIWLARAPSRLVAASLALIIGGALGNAADRIAWGAVVDFILFHITTPSFTFRWYVFNLADVAIVAGVVGLLYDSFRGSGAAKAP
ncbi:signal peptidase II [Xanthobacteraceae bacterium Astr-EGSB]|uniref:signal peptidase II n=1 Tax=Astrobacterium formosum TaxID=3069710 RepID=UPI0027B1DB15|nr:signal peptidase II [Xanthobacteraceae bacterium Astr-EGSB]